MKTIKFKEANVTLTKPESMSNEECGSLPTFTDGRQCVSLWKFTWKERLKVFLFGKIWVGVLSGNTQPPIWLDCSKTVFPNPNKLDFNWFNFAPDFKKILGIHFKPYNFFNRVMEDGHHWGVGLLQFNRYHLVYFGKANLKWKICLLFFWLSGKFG